MRVGDRTATSKVMKEGAYTDIWPSIHNSMFPSYVNTNFLEQSP